MSEIPPAIVFFDGRCVLCNGAVDFLLKRDRLSRLRFAALESETARALLPSHGIAPESLESMVLLKEGVAYIRSTAALRVAQLLPWPWSLMGVFLIVPRPLRDFCYDIVARYRYRIFGVRAHCRVPLPEEADRFLS